MGEIRGELLHLSHCIGRLMLQEHGVIAAHDFIAGLFRRRFVAAGGEVIRNLAEDPGIGRRRAADHHRVAAGFLHHANRVLRRKDIAVADDRDLHRGLHFGDAGPIGMTAIALLARARVQRDGRQAAVFGQLGHLHVDQFLVVPSGAEFHRQRNGNGRLHGAQKSFDQRQIAQQAGTAIAPDHFLHRAAEVDIDVIEAQILAIPRGIGHDLRDRSRRAARRWDARRDRSTGSGTRGWAWGVSMSRPRRASW